MSNLILIFGDQLSHELSALDEFDAHEDRIVMGELHEEASRVWCHKKRLIFFFSAMRHFRDELEQRGFHVDYHQLTAHPEEDSVSNFRELLARALEEHDPDKVIITQPGDFQVWQAIQQTAADRPVELEIRPDRHFYCSSDEFNEWADGKKTLILENFYRWMRQQHKVFLEADGKPIGGQWNFDKDNRQSFGRAGPDPATPPKKFIPDNITREVIAMIHDRFGDHPGSPDDFDYPVTAEQARESLQDFVDHRLEDFGAYQDAMWTDTEFLNHSRLSAVLNVHLLDPRDAIDAAISAYQRQAAPVNSVEGFIRQVIGWREFIRGIYWRHMPDYIEMNALDCQDRDVPQSFWDGETDMNCIRQSMQIVIRHGYAHHIQRLMVLGLWSQLLGVHPRRFHDWHMAMYVDAIDWVSLPNALGMSQHADGGLVGTKPYCASGNYINKMSNYCKQCKYNYRSAVGDDACPITTLYWDFLHRHQDQFNDNGRMNFQMRNLEKKDADQLQDILRQATRIKEQNA